MRHNACQRTGMRLLITGGTGVLGRALQPLAGAVRDFDGVLHLATRIHPLDTISDLELWRENDRLRADASRILVDAAIAAGAEVYVQPTVTFVYPPEGPVSEDTPVGEVLPILRSALAAEQQT